MTHRTVQDAGPTATATPTRPLLDRLHSGTPLLGDPVYGGGFASKANLLAPLQREALSDLGRQALHAAHLSFAHPRTGETLSFDAPLPADMTQLVEALRAVE